VRISDFESWNEIGLEKRMLNKKLKLNFALEMRLDENASHINNYFTNLGISYKLHDQVVIGLGYRYIKDNKDEDGYQNIHRLNLDLRYNHKVERLKLGYKIRLQHKKEMPYHDVNRSDLTDKVRFRGKAEYDFRNWKLDPYISGEMFYSREKFIVKYIESIDELQEISGFEKLRVTVGTSYNIKKVGEIGIYYRIEQEFSAYPKVYNTPGTYYIVGANFIFKL